MEMRCGEKSSVIGAGDFPVFGSFGSPPPFRNGSDWGHQSKFRELSRTRTIILPTLLRYEKDKASIDKQDFENKNFEPSTAGRTYVQLPAIIKNVRISLCGYYGP